MNEGSRAEGAVGGAGSAQGDGQPGAEEDDQIRGPSNRSRTAPFKPGASTWDTDDAREAARKVGKRALAEQKEAEKEKKKQRQGRVVPADWWAEHYKPRYEASVETVGLASRSVTSTTSAVTTRNERVQKLVHRCAFAFTTLLWLGQD